MTNPFKELEYHGYVSDYVFRSKDGEWVPSVDLEYCLANFYQKGTRVVFTDEGGYDGQRERAAQIIGDSIVTVSTCHIGGTMSYYTFEETGSEQFNTVMFAEFD